MRRAAGALAVVLAALTLQGCVYLRLLEVKSQLASFDRHVAAVTVERGLRLELEEPTLRAEDLELLGVVPFRRFDREGEAVWEVRMRREAAEPGALPAAEDLWVELGFREGRLASALIPRAYVETFSEELFVESLEALGASRVMALRKAVSAESVGSEASGPRVAEGRVRATFGEPDEERREGGLLYLEYRYMKRMSAGHEEPEERVYPVVFALDEAAGRLVAARTRSIEIVYASGVESPF